MEAHQVNCKKGVDLNNLCGWNRWEIDRVNYNFLQTKVFRENQNIWKDLDAQFCQCRLFTLGTVAVCLPECYSLLFLPGRGMALLHQWLLSSGCGSCFWSQVIGQMSDTSLNMDSTVTNQTLYSLWASHMNESLPGCCHGRRGWRWERNCIVSYCIVSYICHIYI